MTTIANAANQSGFTPTAEQYARRYPDVPMEVILKEDLLRLGLTITPAGLAAARDKRQQAYYLFSYNISDHKDMGEDLSTGAPEDILFRGGPYGLRRTSVRVVLNEASPYALDVVDGETVISQNGVVVADAIYPDKPVYYGRSLRRRPPV